MATPQKIMIPQHTRAELSLSQRLAASEISQGPSFQHFTVSVLELLVVIKNWALGKFFVLKSSQSVEIGGFNRPRSGGAFVNEGKMKDELGIAKYRKDLSSTFASHRK